MHQGHGESMQFRIKHGENAGRIGMTENNYYAHSRGGLELSDTSDYEIAQILPEHDPGMGVLPKF